MLSEAQKIRNRLGGHAKAAKYSGAAAVAAAHLAAHWTRYYDIVDPERVLSEVERNRRAIAARREHMLRMQLAKMRKAKAAELAAENRRTHTPETREKMRAAWVRRKARAKKKEDSRVGATSS